MNALIKYYRIYYIIWSAWNIILELEPYEGRIISIPNRCFIRLYHVIFIHFSWLMIEQILDQHSWQPDEKLGNYNPFLITLSEIWICYQSTNSVNEMEKLVAISLKYRRPALYTTHELMTYFRCENENTSHLFKSYTCFLTNRKKHVHLFFDARRKNTFKRKRDRNS